MAAKRNTNLGKRARAAGAPRRFAKGLSWAAAHGALAAALVVQAPNAAAQDGAAGEEIYQGVCRNCHGPTAKGMASYPRLVGHEAAYLIDRLKTYRAGEQVSWNSALMIPHAQPLSDADIENIAAYLTGLDP
ncbi:MAG: c-type cytochrome [Pseudomonadota bacterium]